MGEPTVPGEHVPQRWNRLTKDEPCLVSTVHPSRRAVRDDTISSDMAPEFISRLNAFAPAPMAPWDFITKDRKKHLRKAVYDDTSVSVDAPEWFNQELRSAQPPPTRPFARYALGNLKRVVLKPLVEVDPWGQEQNPQPLEAPDRRPGYFPTHEQRKGGVLRPGELPARLHKTTAAELGAGDYDAEARARREAPRDRNGLTWASEVGSGERARVDPLPGSHAADLAASRLHTRAGGVEGTARLHHGTARFVDEPPFRGYYEGARAGLPDGSGLVKSLRTGPAGHLLWHSMVLEHGTRPGQHMEGTAARLYEQGLASTTERLVPPSPRRAGTAPAGASRGRGGFSTTGGGGGGGDGGVGDPTSIPMRQVPLNYYNAVR